MGNIHTLIHIKNSWFPKISPFWYKILKLQIQNVIEYKIVYFKVHVYNVNTNKINNLESKWLPNTNLNCWNSEIKEMVGKWL